MKMKLTAMVGGLMVLTTAAFALPPMWKVFDTTYKPAKNGTIAKATCVVCHVAKGKTALNLYGQDVKKQIDGKTVLKEEDLKKIEELDSDKDGVNNIAEIKGDSLPGDPKSKPAKK